MSERACVCTSTAAALASAGEKTHSGRCDSWVTGVSVQLFDWSEDHRLIYEFL